MLVCAWGTNKETVICLTVSAMQLLVNFHTTHWLAYILQHVICIIWLSNQTKRFPTSIGLFLADFGCPDQYNAICNTMFWLGDSVQWLCLMFLALSCKESELNIWNAFSKACCNCSYCMLVWTTTSHMVVRNFLDVNVPTAAVVFIAFWLWSGDSGMVPHDVVYPLVTFLKGWRSATKRTIRFTKKCI